MSAAFYYYKRPAGGSYDKVVVKRSTVQVAVHATGVVQAQNRLEIKPPIAGRIEEILVEEGQAAKKGSILAWMSSTERVALVDTASARGEAEKKKWEALYRPTPILAPLTGLLILKSVEPGQTVTAVDVVLVMSDHLIVRVDVDETDIGKLTLKQKASLTLDAYPAETITGHVDHIAYDAKTANNVTVYQVDVLPDKVPDFMRSGMTANVSFRIEQHDDVLVLPTEAVKTREGDSTVLVAAASPSDPPRSVIVETGLTDGKKVEIVAGIEEGSQVLVPKLTPMGERKKSTNPFSPMRGGGGGRR